MHFSILKESVGVLFLFCAAFACANTATVVSVVGKVEVSRNNEWVALSTNAVIREGEVISTGFKSEAVIRYKDSVMKLGPLTRVTLEKLTASESKDDVSVFLNTGSVRSTVSHSENKRISYTVRNPIAVASVRGTDFSFFGNTVQCFDGAVAVVPAFMVNPARDLGVSYSDGAASERDNKGADGLPAEGESNAFTPVSDINPNLPKGVLVSAGQSTAFTDTVSARAPKPRSDGFAAHEDFSRGIVPRVPGDDMRGFFGRENPAQSGARKSSLVVDIRLVE